MGHMDLIARQFFELFDRHPCCRIMVALMLKAINVSSRSRLAIFPLSTSFLKWLIDSMILGGGEGALHRGFVPNASRH